MSDQYYGMTPIKFTASLQGLLLLPKGYDTKIKYPLIFHFCGNGENGTNLALLMNTGFGRQVALGRITGTDAEKVINVIIQSPSSGAIAQPNNFNPCWDYMVKNYSVDLTTDENGLYKFVGMAALSQGSADIWSIRTWDNAVQGFGTAVNGIKIKYVWIGSIPSLFPSNAAYQRAKYSVYHFCHGSADNGPNNCCQAWPAQDMNTALNKNGSISTFELVPGGLHDNNVWDRLWNPLAVKEWNIYQSVLDGYGNGQIEIGVPCKFSYAKDDGSMWYEENGLSYSNNVYKTSSGLSVKPIQIF